MLPLLAFDVSTPHGRMLATIIAGKADFARELIEERIRGAELRLPIKPELHRCALMGSGCAQPSQPADELPKRGPYCCHDRYIRIIPESRL